MKMLKKNYDVSLQCNEGLTFVVIVISCLVVAVDVGGAQQGTQCKIEGLSSVNCFQCAS
jgi:hypothetical protein